MSGCKLAPGLQGKNASFQMKRRSSNSSGRQPDSLPPPGGCLLGANSV